MIYEPEAGDSNCMLSFLDSDIYYAVLPVTGLLLSPDPIPDGLVPALSFYFTSIVFLLILKWF